MGQFSTEIYIPPGSTLNGNQQTCVWCKVTENRPGPRLKWSFPLSPEPPKFTHGSHPNAL